MIFTTKTLLGINMAERVTFPYQRLFEVRILHHYWLDDGNTVFDATKKDKRLLLEYNVQSFLEIAPTAATQAQIKAVQGVFKTTTLGFLVAVPKTQEIPDDAFFEFYITIKNTDFFNYTALTLQNRAIYELYHPAKNKTFRYKENVTVLSNLTGISRGSGSNQSLYLSKEFSTIGANDPIESLVLAGSALAQLTSDQPGATTQQLGAQATNMPVFVHQNDTETIAPPTGLEGSPPLRGILLSDGMPDQVFALIRIAAVRPGNVDFSCTELGLPKAIPPVFQIRFKNRSSTWKYFNKTTKIPTTTEANPLPLTYFGNAGTKLKPNAGFVKPIKQANRIVQLVSEIYE
jgi:hypothetical protein